MAGQVEWVQADLSTWQPRDRYDLVTTHYAHPEMPQLDFYDRIASWVAPRGTLLIVGHLHHGHDQENERGHEHGKSQPPPEASVTATAITDHLDPDMWSIVTADEKQRTMTGPKCQRTVIHDVVVRATRRN